MSVLSRKVAAVHVSSAPAKAQRWARNRRTTHVLLKVVVLAVGGSLVAAGLAMLVLPGPGLAAIALGLVVLATEFAWATRILDPLRDRMKSAGAHLRRRLRRTS